MYYHKPENTHYYYLKPEASYHYEVKHEGANKPQTQASKSEKTPESDLEKQGQ